MSIPQPPRGPQDPLTVTAILDALKAAKDEIAGVKDEIVRLRRYGRRNRAFVLLDVLLTVGLTAFGFLSVHAAQSASQANSAQMALCQAGNTARAQQIQLWSHLLNLPATDSKPRTKAQQEEITGFEVYIRSIFKNRDCASLGRK